MKIAMMTNNYKPFIGGVPISIERLSQDLRQLGHEVTVFAPTYREQQEEETVVRYHSLLQGIAGGASVPNSLDRVIEKQFKEGRFDVIHVHHPMLIGRTAGYLSCKYKVPLIFTYHTRYEQYLHYVGLSAVKKLMPVYIREYTRHCDMVIAPTPLMKDYLEDIKITAPVRVLPTGITRESFYPQEEKANALRKELLKEKKYLFCTVARLAKEKNISFLLRSLAIRKKAGHNDFCLALIGEGPEKEQLQRQARQLDLEKEIIFTGRVPNSEIREYCKAADLFLFPSTSETQGIVLLEGMAAGTPVLAVEATGTRDIVINGKNGYMTEEKEEVFAEKLMDILKKKEIEFLRTGARETAENYSSSLIAEKALIYYYAAIQIRKDKEQAKMQRRNHRESMVNFLGAGNH